MSITLDGSNVSSVGTINFGTAQNSTSGTSLTFTGMPAATRRVMVCFSDVSTNSTDAIVLRIGSGGVTTTGYKSASESGNGGLTPRVSTTYFFVTGSSNASGTVSGHVILTNVSGNTWAASGNVFDTASGTNSAAVTYTISAGNVTIGGSLTHVQVTTANGTNTFDAGTINILYE